MSYGAGLYRALVGLYPAEFRREFRPDLEQHFADLLADRGAPAAWARTSFDLVVTVPRYRLESVMSARSTAFTLVAAPTVLASLGVFSVFTGVVPLAGLGLLVVAAALFVARFAKLARALNVTAAERDVRRHRFTIAAICAVVLLGSYVGYMVALSDDEIGGGTLVAYNVVGVPAMIGTVAFFIAGVLSPKATPVRETN